MKTFIQSPVGARTIVNGRMMDFFAGTGYLGLQDHPDLIQNVTGVIQKYGFSSAVPRGGLGEHPVYDRLEEQACAFFGAEKVSVFASGYLGAMYLTQATGTLFDHVFIDGAAHFSLWDAAQGTNKPLTVFHHLSPEDLRAKMDAELEPGERPLVLTDGIFPISGEIAPLPDYVMLVENRHGLIYVDDAHAAGVVGQNGRGTPEYFGITGDVVKSCVTLSKAFGASGGMIYGTKGWVEGIEKDSRICAGASTLSLAAAAAAASALQIAREQPRLRDALQVNVEFLRQGLRKLGLPIIDSPAPIICIPADIIDIFRVKADLFKADIAVEIVRGYTSAPAGGALRIAVFATHKRDQLTHLLTILKKIL